MFWHLKNRIKEETGNDVDLIPSVVNPNHPKHLIKDKHSHHGSTTSLGSFTIDGNKEDAQSSFIDMKLADGKIITAKEFKKLESKEEEWRKKLQKKDEEQVVKLKKVEDSWKKQLEEKDREMKEELEKKENEKKILEDERNELKVKNAILEESARRAADYKKKVCQYQEDIDQLEGFQTQEMAKIKHLLLVKEQELAEKDKLLKENNSQIKLMKSELTRLRNLEQQYENAQDDLETLRHSFDLEKAQLSSKLAEKEEDVRHLKDRVALLEERANSGPIGEMTVDERVQKLLGERALFERRLEEAHLHLSQIKSTWSSKIECLETQVGRLCRQASEESSEKRQAELERDLLKERMAELEGELEGLKVKSMSKDGKIEKLKIEKSALEEELKKLKTKREEDIRCFHEEIKSVTENAFDIEEKLGLKINEAKEKDSLIKNLKSTLDDEKKSKSILESEVQKLKEALEAERNLSEEINSVLEKERREKDEMMMRNAQVSQEVELVRQESRKQELEATEMSSKMIALENKLSEKQKDFDRATSEKLELYNKIKELEKIQKEQEFASTVERDLKAKVVQLENELFEKNKSVKILQQRLSDIKKTLQRELKVPSTAIDPGGTDAESFITPFASNASTGSSPAVLTPSSSHHLTSSPRCRSEETYGDANDDVNFKYLKHVLMKFLTSRECEVTFPDFVQVLLQMIQSKPFIMTVTTHDDDVQVILVFTAQHLTRAVATLLRFSAEEERLLKETLEWKMSWFGTRPNLGNGQTAKTIPPS